MDDCAILTLLWINGYSLNNICEWIIKIRKPGTENAYFLNRTNQNYNEILNIDWDTKTINLVMKNLQKIQFVLGKYFQKVSKELTIDGTPLENDWYQFLEYGTCSDLLMADDVDVADETREVISNNPEIFSYN